MKLSALILGAGMIALSAQADNFLPPTMGWSSWNTFALNINEDVIKGQADAMVATGLDKAGYKYVNIDDGYWDGRGEDGHLRLNTKLFPSGMRNLVDYIHSIGLKAGIYSDAGDNTCGSGNVHPWGCGVGLAGYEDQDCKLYFIDWDFDFIKVDYCGGIHMGLDERKQYTNISNAIKNCGKPGVVFNVCRWAYPGTWISDISDSWRTTGDIYCHYNSVRGIVKENLYLQAYTGGGHYNDMDMLEIGRTLNPDEENTHMAYWCIASSPLLIGCDLTSIPDRSLELLKNPDLLAMNQDKLGLGAPVVQRQGDVYVVAKDMEKVMGNKRAVVVMNLSDQEQTIPLSLSKAGFEGAVKVRDCLLLKDIPGMVSGSMNVTVPAHGAAAYFLTGKRNEKSVYEGEEAYLPAYQELGKGHNPGWAESPTANQGVYITRLGNGADNSVQWNNVYSKKGGNYQVTLRYSSKLPANMEVVVNGKSVKNFSSLQTGDDNNWQTVSIPVKLKKGENKVELRNADSALPNIDCMGIKKI